MMNRINKEKSIEYLDKIHLILRSAMEHAHDCEDKYYGMKFIEFAVNDVEEYKLLKRIYLSIVK